jgi:hypothetical protein
VTNTSGGRGRDRAKRKDPEPDRTGRAGKPAARRVAPGKSGAPAKRGAPGTRSTSGRSGARRDPAALPALGPDDERPYPRARDARSTRDARDSRGAGAPRTGRRPLGDRAQSGVKKRTSGGDRAAKAGNRSLPRGAAGPRSARREGEVTGPFKRRPAPAPVEERRPVLRLAPGKGSPGKGSAAKGSPAKRSASARASGASSSSRNAPERARRASTTARGAGDGSPARKRRRPTEATEELRRLAGGNANRAVDTLARASEAFARGRERDALRILRPLAEAYPGAAAVRELAGLCRYRIGFYAVAADDLAAFADLTGSTEQHPVLMDCRRAQRKLRAVEELWEELRETSPSAALVTEGRIVLAGALADAGRLADAIDLLARRAEVPGRTKEHTVRLWYALADLEERAGDVPRARALFEQVRRFDAEFADVAERLAALS